MEKVGRGVWKRVGPPCGILPDSEEREECSDVYSTKYAEVINASIAANSAGIDYRCCNL